MNHAICWNGQEHCVSRNAIRKSKIELSTNLQDAYQQIETIEEV